MKYIHLDCKPYMVVFPEFVGHDEMAYILLRERFDSKLILGAGFCNIGTSEEETRCWGESVGLQAKCTPDCTRTLRKMVCQYWGDSE